jgi:NurA-like 5'-3' nuclease
VNKRNAPISQVEVESEIMRLMELLEEHTEAFEQLAEDSAKKEALYKSNWAKEYLSAKGSIREREAWSDYKLSDESYDYKISEALVKAKREKLISLRTSIDALRTLNANVRTQIGHH